MNVDMIKIIVMPADSRAMTASVYPAGAAAWEWQVHTPGPIATARPAYTAPTVRSGRCDTFKEALAAAYDAAPPELRAAMTLPWSLTHEVCDVTA